LSPRTGSALRQFRSRSIRKSPSPQPTLRKRSQARSPKWPTMRPSTRTTLRNLPYKRRRKKNVCCCFCIFLFFFLKKKKLVKTKCAQSTCKKWKKKKVEHVELILPGPLLLRQSETGVLVSCIDLADAADVSRRSERHVELGGHGQELVDGIVHRLLQTTVDNVALRGSGEDALVLCRVLADVDLCAVVKERQEVALAALLPFFVEATETDVREVFEPLFVQET